MLNFAHCKFLLFKENSYLVFDFILYSFLLSFYFYRNLLSFLSFVLGMLFGAQRYLYLEITVTENFFFASFHTFDLNYALLVSTTFFVL